MHDACIPVVSRNLPSSLRIASLIDAHSLRQAAAELVAYAGSGSAFALPSLTLAFLAAAEAVVTDVVAGAGDTAFVHGLAAECERVYAALVAAMGQGFQPDPPTQQALLTVSALNALIRLHTCCWRLLCCERALSRRTDLG